jgi:hypothetical protein
MLRDPDLEVGGEESSVSASLDVLVVFQATSELAVAFWANLCGLSSR